MKQMLYYAVTTYCIASSYCEWGLQKVGDITASSSLCRCHCHVVTPQSWNNLTVLTRPTNSLLQFCQKRAHLF